MDTQTQTTENCSLETSNNNEILVEVTGLSKKFCKDFKTSLWYGVKDLVSGYSGNKSQRQLRPKEFWSVKDISFTLRRGECLGLIGHNGAGKSTLLKILNGLINPDAGKVVIRGRVGALIELGAGFNPILSGRENIYNNGAILGFSRNEIKEKLEKIIEFAELSEFIDMPVQNYSSGMKVRLGFAVAAQMEPDVLIIDEVLAVGDLGFVLKCFKTIDTILPKTAIIFVSHSMPMVSRICNQIILMDRGVAKFQGEDVSKAIDLYYTRFASNDSSVVFSDNTVELKSIDILNVPIHEGIPQLRWGDDINLHLTINVFKEVDKSLNVRLVIFDKEQRPIALMSGFNIDYSLLVKDGILSFEMVHNKLQFSKGIYSMNISITNNTGPVFRANGICEFQVAHEMDVWEPFLLEANVKI